jgi:hypothetical protein
MQLGLSTSGSAGQGIHARTECLRLWYRQSARVRGPSSQRRASDSCEVRVAAWAAQQSAVRSACRRMDALCCSKCWPYLLFLLAVTPSQCCCSLAVKGRLDLGTCSQAHATLTQAAAPPVRAMHAASKVQGVAGAAWGGPEHICAPHAHAACPLPWLPLACQHAALGPCCRAAGCAGPPVGARRGGRAWACIG